MTKPIRPEDIGAAKVENFPAAVFDAFNAEITAKFQAGMARIRQDVVVQRLIDGGFKRQEIFDAGWLNVEDAYRAAGWKVNYDKPGFNEIGEAYFEFIRPVSHRSAGQS